MSIFQSSIKRYISMVLILSLMNLNLVYAADNIPFNGVLGTVVTKNGNQLGVPGMDIDVINISDSTITVNPDELGSNVNPIIPSYKIDPGYNGKFAQFTYQTRSDNSDWNKRRGQGVNSPSQEDLRAQSYVIDGSKVRLKFTIHEKDGSAIPFMLTTEPKRSYNGRLNLYIQEALIGAGAAGGIVGLASALAFATAAKRRALDYITNQNQELSSMRANFVKNLSQDPTYASIKADVEGIAKNKANQYMTKGWSMLEPGSDYYNTIHKAQFVSIERELMREQTEALFKKSKSYKIFQENFTKNLNLSYSRINAIAFGKGLLVGLSFAAAVYGIVVLAINISDSIKGVAPVSAIDSAETINGSLDTSGVEATGLLASYSSSNALRSTKVVKGKGNAYLISLYTAELPGVEKSFNSTQENRGKLLLSVYQLPTAAETCRNLNAKVWGTYPRFGVPKQNTYVEFPMVEAECKNKDGAFELTQLDLNTCSLKSGIMNNNGKLKCTIEAATPPGNYKDHAAFWEQNTVASVPVYKYDEDLGILHFWFYNKNNPTEVTFDYSKECEPGSKINIFPTGNSGRPSVSCTYANLPKGNYKENCDDVWLEKNIFIVNMCKNPDGSRTNSPLALDLSTCKSKDIYANIVETVDTTNANKIGIVAGTPKYVDQLTCDWSYPLDYRSKR